MEAPEVLHDTPTPDVHAWQPIASLARSLKIAERTVRHRVAQGALERLRLPDGRTYYRQPRAQSAAAADDGTATPLAIATMARMATEHARELAAATREIVEARASAAAATATQLATAQHLENERQRAQRLEDELRQERQRLEDERQRLEVFARIATAPWYAFRLRRRLRRQLVAPLSSPSGGRATGEDGDTSSA